MPKWTFFPRLAHCATNKLLDHLKLIKNGLHFLHSVDLAWLVELHRVDFSQKWLKFYYYPCQLRFVRFLDFHTELNQWLSPVQPQVRNIFGCFRRCLVKYHKASKKQKMAIKSHSSCIILHQQHLCLVFSLQSLRHQTNY